MIERDIKVLEIERTTHPKIVAVATIHIQGLGRISGIKIVHLNGSIKCEPPNRSFIENGVRKWENVFSFERDVWTKIQNEIINCWRRQCK